MLHKFSRTLGKIKLLTASPSNLDIDDAHGECFCSSSSSSSYVWPRSPTASRDIYGMYCDRHRRLRSLDCCLWTTYSCWVYPRRCLRTFKRRSVCRNDVPWSLIIAAASQGRYNRLLLPTDRRPYCSRSGPHKMING